MAGAGSRRVCCGGRGRSRSFGGRERGRRLVNHQHCYIAKGCGIKSPYVCQCKTKAWLRRLRWSMRSPVYVVDGKSDIPSGVRSRSSDQFEVVVTHVVHCLMSLMSGAYISFPKRTSLLGAFT